LDNDGKLILHWKLCAWKCWEIIQLSWWTMSLVHYFTKKLKFG